MKKFLFTFPLLCALCLLSRKACADDAVFQMMQTNIQTLQESVEELTKTVTSQNEVIQSLSTRIIVLEKRGGQVITASAAVPERAPKLAGLSQGFNPDIGILGNVQTKLTENTSDGEGNDTIALKEVELNFAQVVDPYSRFDGVISFNDAIEAQNLEIEEAYYTRWELPLGFTGQIGKFRSKVGKQNLLHLDQLPTIDFPEVIKNFFGEEGLASSGARLQNWVPNPWDIPVEITGEILRGNNGAIFSGKSRRPIFNAHTKTFFEPTDDIDLELGATSMFGEENASGIAKGDDRFGTHVFGGDATAILNLPEGRVVKWQNEVFFTDGASNRNANEDPWGFYSLLDLKISPQWSTGIRFDYLEPIGVTRGHNQTTGVSPYLTFWQSEFANFSLQYTHLEPANPAEKSDDMIVLQAEFLIGVHKHPVQ